MRPDGTQPRMNSDARQLVRNWLTVAMHTENKEQIFILEKLLASCEPMPGETLLDQNEIDRIFGVK